MNKVQLIGNVTKDLELKESAKQIKYVQFNLAVNNYIGGNKEAKVDYINIVAFGSQAEVLAQYTKKGNKLAVIGRLSSDQYTNKEGIKNFGTRVLLENFEFLTRKKPEVVQE